MNETAQILIVEDEANIRLFLEHLLKREGYQITLAPDGEKALEHIRARRFDLIILDLNLGRGVSGMDVLTVVHDTTPQTAVILLTGYATLETAIAALRQGAHDYLLKPCQADQIRLSVRNGLQKREKEQQRQTLLTQLEQNLQTTLDGIRAIGGDDGMAEVPVMPTTSGPNDRFLRWGRVLVADLTRHMMMCGNKVLPLSPTEFELLVYLLKHAPRVITPQEIMAQVQGYSGDTWDASEVVRPHIYRLRQKLKASCGRDDIIQTVRGVGYAINDDIPD